MKSKERRAVSTSAVFAHAASRRKSIWGNKGMQFRKLFPLVHGDGKSAIFLSFFAAPELLLVVLIDSRLDNENFRDLLDEIYETCEDTWDDPPAGAYRHKQLSKMQREYEKEDAPSKWSLVIDGGSSWCWKVWPNDLALPTQGPQ